MNRSHNYILVLSPQHSSDPVVQSLMGKIADTVFIAQSADQAVARIEQGIPYLVILSGAQQSWAPALVSRLRETVKPLVTTIVALTQSHEPSWSPHEDHPDIDGFLVEPISQDILSLLVKSAAAKTTLQSKSWV